MDTVKKEGVFFLFPLSEENKPLLPDGGVQRLSELQVCLNNLEEDSQEYQLSGHRQTPSDTVRHRQEGGGHLPVSSE